MIIENSPLYKEMKAALAENRLDAKSKISAREKLATLERILDTARLTPSEIETIHKQMAAIKERYTLN